MKKSQPNNEIFRKVFAWMFVGLALSGISSLLVLSNESIMNLILGNNFVFYGLIILELILVFYLSIWIKKMSSLTATIVFMIYSFVTGLTFSAIFLVYTLGSIATIFFITAFLFALMSAIGYFTSKDLTSLGMFLFVGLIGIIIASLVNFFLKNSMLDYIISWIAVVIFLGLTAYDIQRIKKGNMLGSPDSRKVAIMGALSLYLDFINLFLSLLNLFGDRN